MKRPKYCQKVSQEVVELLTAIANVCVRIRKDAMWYAEGIQMSVAVVDNDYRQGLVVMNVC